MAYGPKRPMIFHNALASCGPVRVTVDNEPKWTKKNNYAVELTLHTNPPQEGTYWAENNACGEFFKGKKGQTFTIVASGGGKSDAEKASAAITYVGEAGQSAPPPAQQQQSAPPPQQRGQTPPNAKSKDGLHDLKAFIGRNETGIKIALKRAVAVKADFELEYNSPLPEEIFHSIFSGMLYGVTASGVINTAPSFVEFKTLMPRATAPGSNQPPPQQQAPPPPPPKIMCGECGATEVQVAGDWCKACLAASDVPF